MKELSIEQKAKAYDEAKLRMSAAYNSNRCTIGFMNEIFPELKESEDERIRKNLIACISTLKHPLFSERERKEFIAWLEKQGEQKPADKVEPKFKVGDWVVNNDNGCIYQITSIRDNEYCLWPLDSTIEGFLKIADIDNNTHLYTIQDAKDGDVLVDQNGEMPFIFKECKNNHVYCYCGYTNRKDVFFDKFVNNKNEELHWLNLYHEQAYPATKEQRDLLFKVIHEAGYEWDAEKKELKKIDIETEIPFGAKDS